MPGHDLPTIARLRRAAIARFGELGFPGERDEDWKFTNVGPIVRTPMRYDNGLSPCVECGSLPHGVQVLSLKEGLNRFSELIESHLGQYADFKQHPFVALNTAFWRDGLFIYIPPGAVVEPITVVWSTEHQSDIPALYYRRLLIVVGTEAQFTLVEDYHGIPQTHYLTNAVTEIVLGERALVDHYKIQHESPNAYHLATTQVVAPYKSNFSTHYFGMGGELVRNEVRVKFTGSHAEATVNGLYLARGTQHMDNHTVIDHAMPHCASHELYKGILDDKARGVFNGKIFVRLDAQKTDAKQTNQTLLLSDDATINTKPQLEIYADDVKCTHGATVGQLDEQQLFYLRSRGIGADQARSLLTYAFANDIVSRIQVPSLRQKLERTLLEANHLPKLEEGE